MLIRNAEIHGRPGVDARVRDGLVVELGTGLRPAGDDLLIDASGGALIPGLHDHHLHLRALAAEEESVRVGPCEVGGPAGMARALRAAPRGMPGGWVRAVGYHEAVAGRLDRRELDAMVDDRPVRVQHRSGVLWVLNSAALAATDAEALDDHRVERDASGNASGRLWRLDAWLASVTPRVETDLARVSRRAASAGVTGFTDATPNRPREDAVDLAAAAGDGRIVQRLHLLSPDDTSCDDPEGVVIGPVKIMLDDDRLPAFSSLVAAIERAHARGTAVAIHCVTRVQLALALAALELAGASEPDRIEHASLVGSEELRTLRRLGVTVVTQPNFVAERGNEYLREVDEADRPDLYRCASLRDAGIPLAAGTDAPFGRPDPWAAIRAAVERRPPDAPVIGAAERLDPAAALGLFLGDPSQPGRRRTVSVGAVADLCLLRVPIREALRILSKDVVRAVVVAGRLVGPGA